MKLSEWLQEDTIAILRTAIYYGIPKYGHERCYKQIDTAPHGVERVTRSDLDVLTMRCSGCGKLLVPVESA